VHDLQAIGVFLFIFCAVMFFMPEMGGYFLEYANFEEANPLKTPEHIAPVWYFTPFYSVLRAVPDKFWGFVAFAASVAIPFLLPWLDRSPVKSWRYRGNITKVMLVVFTASFLILGVLGVKSPTRVTHGAHADLHHHLLRVLPADAGVVEHGQGQARAAARDHGRWYRRARQPRGPGADPALTIVPLKVVGAESAYDCGTMPCDEIDSIQTRPRCRTARRPT
jgi:ubiquinol-cytochrome c reductase cytochrome b subunit